MPSRKEPTIWAYARIRLRWTYTVTGASRSPVLCIRSSAVRSGRLAAEQQATPVVLVEPLEDRSGDGQGVLVVAGHGQPPQHDVEAGGLGGVEQLVVQVGLMHDLGDPPQHRVGQLI